MSTTHLMIVHPRYIAPLLSGTKSLESRLGQDRRAPFGKVSLGDVVYIKPTGQRVIAKAIVHRVEEFEDLNPDDILNLREMYDDRIMGGDQYWESKSSARYATLIEFKKVSMLRDESTVPSELLVANRNAWRIADSSNEPEDRQAA
ncbi:MAG: hypothetical protein JJ974_06880 [Phycisphaerales bacterium]|nr:hypothetical protein [Phycisphaerales bacterium]